jgi:hypothetical protein
MMAIALVISINLLFVLLADDYEGAGKMKY